MFQKIQFFKNIPPPHPTIGVDTDGIKMHDIMAFGVEQDMTNGPNTALVQKKAEITIKLSLILA